MSDKTRLIKNIYLYLVSIIGLLMIAIPVGNLINIGLKTFVFTKADRYYYDYPMQAPCDTANKVMAATATTTTSTVTKTDDQTKNERQEQERLSANRQSELASSIAFLIVGIPLFSYHWHLARKKEEETN